MISPSLLPASLCIIKNRTRSNTSAFHVSSRWSIRLGRLLLGDEQPEEPIECTRQPPKPSSSLIINWRSRSLRFRWSLNFNISEIRRVQLEIDSWQFTSCYKCFMIKSMTSAIIHRRYKSSACSPCWLTHLEDRWANTDLLISVTSEGNNSLAEMSSTFSSLHDKREHILQSISN